MGTGYKVGFPMLSKHIINQSDDFKVPLYKQVFPPHLPHASLALIGVIQPNGALFPCFEMQSRWFAQIMAGRCHLPSQQEMMADIHLMDNSRKKVYYHSQRHALELDWISYMDDIAKRIGVMPNLILYAFTDPLLCHKLIFGTALSYHYRLVGPHSWSGARNAIMKADDNIKYGLMCNKNK